LVALNTMFKPGSWSYSSFLMKSCLGRVWSCCSWCAGERRVLVHGWGVPWVPRRVCSSPYEHLLWWLTKKKKKIIGTSL